MFLGINGVYYIQEPGCLWFDPLRLLHLHTSAFHGFISFPPPPLPLSLCLQPIRRPFLQPTFSLDCISAPPLHHCQQNQRFASHLSLCTGNAHPSSPSSSSHSPAPPLASLPLNFPTHFFSSTSSEPNSPLLQRTPLYKRSLSEEPSKFNSDLTFSPLWFPPTYPGTPITTSGPANSSHSFPWHFSPLLPQPNPNFDSLRCSLSNSCPYKQSPPSFPSFHPDTQTNPCTIDLLTQHTAMQSGWSAPLFPPHTDNVLSVSCNLSSASLHSPSPMSTSHMLLAIPSSEGAVSRPFQAGGVQFRCTNVFS